MIVPLIKTFNRNNLSLFRENRNYANDNHEVRETNQFGPMRQMILLVCGGHVSADLRGRHGERAEPGDPGLGGRLLPAPPLPGQPEAD